MLESYISPDKEYKVSKESMITYKGQKYSVPTYLIGKTLQVKESASEIQIYYTSDLIVTHNKTSNFLNYKKEHIYEILKSDALKYRSDAQIEEYIEINLKQFDLLLQE